MRLFKKKTTPKKHSCIVEKLNLSPAEHLYYLECDLLGKDRAENRSKSKTLLGCHVFASLSDWKKKEISTAFSCVPPTLASREGRMQVPTEQRQAS